MPLPQQDEFGVILPIGCGRFTVPSQCRFRSKMNSELFGESPLLKLWNVSMPLPQQDEFGEKHILKQVLF